LRVGGKKQAANIDLYLIIAKKRTILIPISKLHFTQTHENSGYLQCLMSPEFMKVPSFVLVVLLSVSCSPSPEPEPDPRDGLVGMYSGIPVKLDGGLKPVPVPDYLIISISLEKAPEADSFELHFGSEILKCVSLKPSASGFTFAIPDQEFSGFGSPGRYSGHNYIEMDGAAHQGVIMLQDDVLKFVVNCNTFYGVKFIAFSGSKTQ